MRHLVMPLLAGAVAVLSTGPAYADIGDQLFKLVPDDGEAGDRFGFSVAISGTTAIVGARFDDDNGFRSGAAYLFDSVTGQQLFKLLADDGFDFDDFGFSVAISGATAIVGAPGDDVFLGSAYFFDISDPKNPVQIAKLLADDGAAFDEFGISVAISGDTAIVGADFDDDNGNTSGSAFVFAKPPNGWVNMTQTAKLLANDGAAGDRFGFSVAISGTTAIVGARADDDNGFNSGSAYVFVKPRNGWVNMIQTAKLLPKDGADFDEFGISVAISGATAIIGAFRDDDNGGNSGSAYLFDTDTDLQIAKLVPNDGAVNDRFGFSVAISGATAIIGAIEDDDNGSDSGSAYLFDATTAAEISKLLPDDGEALDKFGTSVAISGPTAIVGAPFDGVNGKFSGSAYLFDAATAPGTCPWDIDGNANVGAADLLALLVSWGPCKDCPADFDDDGSVGATDLLALLVNWGPCP